MPSATSRTCRGLSSCSDLTTSGRGADVPELALSALGRQPALAGTVVGVILGIDLAHRVLAGALLLRLRGNAWDARDDEQRIGNLRRDADVAAHGRDRPVDVDWDSVTIRQG